MLHNLKTFLFLASLLGIGFFACRQILSDQARGWLTYRFAVVIPLVGIGLLGPGVWAYYSAIFAAMVILPRDRLEAVGLYIFLALLLPLVSYDVYAGSVRLLRAEGHMVAAAGLLGAFRFKGSGTGRKEGGVIAFAVILLLILQSVINARIYDTNATVAARSAVSVLLAIGIPYALIADAPSHDDSLRRPVFYLVAVGIMLSVLASFEMVRHWPMYQTIESNLGTSSGVSRTLALRGGLLRAAGPFFESTTFGVLLAITTICAAAMRSVFRSAPFHLLAVAVGLFGCFATLSRNAWIGVMVGIIVVGFYRGRAAKTFAAAGIIGALALTVIVLTPDSGRSASLLGKGSTTAADTATYRSDLLTASWPLIRARLWIGTPYDQVKDILRDDMRSGRVSVDYVNSYLYFLVTSGLIGLAIFLLYTFAPMISLLAHRRRGSTEESEALAALFAAQVALAVMVVGTSFFERIPVFSILLLAMTRHAISNIGTSAASQKRAISAGIPGVIIIDPLRPTLLRPQAAQEPLLPSFAWQATSNPSKTGRGGS